ncbi:VanW family protein [Clostridium lundense]|uniref:VanW family protein n=1 Tax=Clostridium lundense TaxID=319475 RepID=UPI000486E7F5|nr:VanW family protein [Clostridium lundense]
MVRKKKSKKKGLIIIFSLLAVILLGIVSAGVTYAYSYVKYYDNLFYPGVKVEGVDLSGKKFDEGKKIIKEQLDDKIPNKKLIIKTPDKNYTLTFDKINANYDEDKVLQQAYSYGKNLNLISKYKLIKNAKEKVYKFNFSYNQKPIKDLIEQIEKDVNRNAENAKISKSWSGFDITAEKTGKKLNKDKLQQEIFEKIDGDTEKDIEVNAPIDEIKPHIVKEKLSSINNLISTFHTNYGDISSSQRANNIQIATKGINNTILMPGDVFSFNDIVGERTEARGYQSAAVIVGNQVDSGLGGGICQVSSTLYNAALKANLKSVERVHHTLPSSYVPLGRDATVDWGNIDYKFKNTLPYPIYIEGITSGGNVTFNIYSNSSLTSRYYDITTDVYSRIETTTKKVNDPNLLIGTEEVVQKPYTGFKVNVYKNTYENDKLINKELISNDFYRPVEGLIKVGTKKK